MYATLPMNRNIRKMNKVFFSQRTFWIIISAIIFIIFSYLYFLSTTVMHVTMRQQSERKLSDMTANIATLESQYVDLTSNINIEHAYALGFKDTTSDQTQFVKRSATLGTLGMRQVQ